MIARAIVADRKPIIIHRLSLGTLLLSQAVSLCHIKTERHCPSAILIHSSRKSVPEVSSFPCTGTACQTLPQLLLQRNSLLAARTRRLCHNLHFIVLFQTAHSLNKMIYLYYHKYADIGMHFIKYMQCIIYP